MRTNQQNKKYVKILLLGVSTSGKTCLIERYIKDKFSLAYTRTSEFNIKEFEIKGKDIILQIWDTAGFYGFKPKTT